ncbi:hypothetical protein RclHR1_02030007 [Rhizophagus clarus]|uniref:Kinase-like domain-containing protein n=1 Tax=Rhizophagus clarus TaxID=94130 RepID=A0A2Z6R4F8_9GLOM|nr:hypothetical protein RclHR1_02030007 [Rhizophagus clarus]GES98163.1 kinase-like domain-containing protein [Rhizophagus clarus]
MSTRKPINYQIPLFRVPYPPQLTVEEIVSGRSEDKLGSRAPNRFFLYRLAFLKELRKRTDDTVPMTLVSSYISKSWSKEPIAVKDAYKKLSDQVEDRLMEIRQKEKLILKITTIDDPKEAHPVPPQLPQLPQLPPPQPYTPSVNIEPNHTQIPYFDPFYQQPFYFISIDEYHQMDLNTNLGIPIDFNMYHPPTESCPCEYCSIFFNNGELY